MNTHIFTEREKEVLGDWITGKEDRSSSSHLHVTLNRLRRSEKQLRYEVKFLSLALRRLHVQNLRHRPDDLETTLTLLPFRLTARSIVAYTLLMLKMRQAIDAANDIDLSIVDRLDSAIKALEIAELMVKPSDPDIRLKRDS